MASVLCVAVAGVCVMCHRFLVHIDHIAMCSVTVVLFGTHG